MNDPTRITQEAMRLAALERYGVLDSPPEQCFDDLVRLAAEICGAPISLVSLIDQSRQWFKATYGLEVRETPRDVAFCAHAIEGEALFEVPDATQDRRFADNPLVIEEPHIRFYAGVPLTTPDQFRLGTLCVIDRKPRRLSDSQRRDLARLARQVGALLELRIANAELAAARVEAEAANRAKGAFLATMSHEIRTPLNAIIGTVGLIEKTTAEDERRRLLQVLSTSSMALSAIVDDVLDFSKIESGKISLRPETISLQSVVDAVVETFSPSAAGRGLGLAAVIDPGIPDRLICDPYRLRQILMNLVGNAVKFTQQGGVQIVASLLSMNDDRVNFAIDVVDSGNGIDSATQARLFEPFAQAETTTPGDGGTGLGLAISRQLSGLLGGTLNLRCTSETGTTMRLELDLARAANQLPAQRVTLQSAPSAPSRVLIADDNVVNLEILACQLKVLGHSVATAEDGLQALQKWLEGDFDLILADCHMPTMDGYELAKEVRAVEARDKTKKATPIIAYTANALLDGRERCLRAGMNDVLVKPVQLQSLTAILSRWLPAADAPETKE